MTQGNQFHSNREDLSLTDGSDQLGHGGGRQFLMVTVSVARHRGSAAAFRDGCGGDDLVGHTLGKRQRRVGRRLVGLKHGLIAARHGT